MKKSVKIILIIIAVLLAGAGIFGYNIYKMVMGAEELSGKLENIPTEQSAFPPLTKDSADFPHWRGINFDGKNNTKGIKKDWSSGLKMLWQVDYLCQGNSTASWSAPVIQGNRLIIPGRDENNDLVFCLNSNDGKLIWKGSYPSTAETSHGPGARATPFIDDDRVYTFGRSGDLVCWKLEDGKILWKQNVKNIGGVEPQWGFSTTPLVYENKIIVQGGGSALIIAYDKMSGNVLWKSMQGNAGYAACIPVKADSIDQLLIYHGKALSCVNPDDGKEIWSIPWATEYDVNATTPAIADNIVFHTSSYEMGGEALEITQTGYKVLWKNKVMSAQQSDPIIIDGYIYGYAGESVKNKGLFKCVELKTGKEIWSTDKMGQGTTTFADGHLICMDLKGNIFLVKPDPKSFVKVSEMKMALTDVKNLAWTVPVIANGKLYLRYLQHLVCYSLM